MSSATVKKHFVASLRRALRPIVRQAIAHGVSYPAFARMLKRLYVEVADDGFRLAFKRQTDSRVALLTGITRKDIAALRKPRGDGDGDEEIVDVEDSVATFAVGRWLAGPPFATPDGRPRRLRYESEDATEATFSNLVRSLGLDIPVRAILDELIRLGSVELDARGEVTLVREAHIPPSGIEGKLALLGSDPAELYSTIAHNIEDQETPWLQRKVAYDNIGSDALAALREEARRTGEDFVRRANALLSSYDRDRHPEAPGGRRSRVALGVYYYEEVSPKTDDQAGPAEKPTGPPGRIKKRPAKTKKSES